MRNFTISLVIFLLAAPLLAADPLYNMGEFPAGAKAHLYGDRVNVREAPSIKAKVAAGLPIGSPVTVIAKTDRNHTAEGYTAPWYKIRFTQNGSVKEGYAWGGLIAMAALPLKNGDLVVAGIQSFKSGTPVGQVRLVRKNVMVSSCPFEPLFMPGGEGTYYYSVEGSTMPAKGLDGVDTIISIKCTYGACGYPNGPVFFVKCGDRLAGGIPAPSVSEAGVFHFTTTLIFPNQKGGKKNTIIAVERSETFNEDKKAYEFSEEKRFTYRWNGSTFTSDKKNE